ncbi:OmpA family protein [Vibrio owensii]|uniref:OmpA family protein n=1 Tax=Vibrio owensii TaxID=696485 RepID=UPI0018F2087C|nr:OmpA family protein [Vibrio owensii]
MAGGSSGAWKLALADFMISMMCIFLTLWILQFLDKQEQVKLVEILAPESDSTPELMVLPEKNSISPVSLDSVATSRYKTDLHRVDDTSLIEGRVESQQDLTVLSEKIQQKIARIDGDGAIDVQVTPQGLKITLTDTGNGPMFKMGSTNITPYYQDLLLGMAPTLGALKNKVVIAGHTDASRFIGSDRTNWDLSAKRANKARYYLQRGGVSKRNIFQVIGFGDSALINKNEPRNHVNRRIEIVVLTKQAEDSLRNVYHGQEFSGEDIDQDNVDGVKGVGISLADDNRPLSAFEATKAAVMERQAVAEESN